MMQRSSVPILCLGLTPCLQRTLVFERLRTGRVNRATRAIETASGKATNVARVIQLLGGQARLLGLAGGATGERVAALLREDGLSPVLIPSQHPTRICQTLLDEATGDVTELVEESSALTPEEVGALRGQVTEELQAARWLVISGSPPPHTPSTLYRDFVQQVQMLGGRAIVDTQKEPLLATLPASPWLVKLNQEELGVTLGRDIHTPDEIKDAARVLLERGAQNVVVTHGDHAVWWMDGHGVRMFQPPEIQPLNPIGSGDAMAAGIALGVSRGGALEEALCLGIACGAANALTLTSGVVQPEVVRDLLVKVVKGHAAPW